MNYTELNLLLLFHQVEQYKEKSNEANNQTVHNFENFYLKYI